MSLVKKFITVGGATLGSRIFGFARETLMAAALGTGPMADVFYAAFRFPMKKNFRHCSYALNCAGLNCRKTWALSCSNVWIGKCVRWL